MTTMHRACYLAGAKDQGPGWTRWSATPLATWEVARVTDIVLLDASQAIQAYYGRWKDSWLIGPRGYDELALNIADLPFPDLV